MTGTIERDQTNGRETTAKVDATSIRVLVAGQWPSEGVSFEALSTQRSRIDPVRETDFTVALDRVGVGAVDCVVACHRQGGFDGLAFLEAVRREHPELPVVLVVDSERSNVARRAVDSNVTALIPATDDDALEAVADAIEDNAAVPPGDRANRMPISDLTVGEERRLKERALDEAPVGITISDADEPEDPIIYVNDSFEEMTGYASEEILGVDHRFLQGPDTEQEKIARFAAATEEHRDVRVVLRNYTKDGDQFWNQVDVTPITDEDGEVSHYVGFQMDVTERERAKRELERERETLDRLLRRVNGLLGDVTASLVRGESREEIERSTVERVATGDEFRTAWIGRYDATGDAIRLSESGGLDDAVGTTLELTREEEALRVLSEVVECRETRTVEGPGSLPGLDEDLTAVLIPLTYRSTTYGVLAVYEESQSFNDRERRLLGALGRSIGMGINDVRTKRSMAADSVIRVSVEIGGDTPLTGLAAELGETLEQEATTFDDENGEVVVLVEAESADAEAVLRAAESGDDIVGAEPLVDDDEGCVVQVRLSGFRYVDVLSEFGARATDLTVGPSSLAAEFRVGTESAARGVVDELRDTYESVELVAYREDDPDQPARGFREEVRSELTERQLTALEKAHVGGYFEWPSAIEGQQLADSMDIVPSTYHQHLQAAKRKLVGAFFETERGTTLRRTS
jgi:PAS domain S-box-containing protein